jgi:hypothetical protein
LRAQLWPLYKRLLQHSSAPILVGPWRGEVGFEVLYWIPFVKRLAKRLQIDPQRLIPVTRGGAGQWYGGAPGLELYDLRSPQEVRVENRVQHAKSAMLKQICWTAFDHAVIRDAATRLNLRRYLVLHPAWMFARLTPFFASAMGLTQLEEEALFDPLPAPPLPEGLTLPERFVAVRFYLRHTYPGLPQLVQFAQETIRTIANHTPVVLLNSGVHVDEHQDVQLPPTANVSRLTDLCAVTPANNLAVQSAVLGKALGFVGTYGGLSQLALRLGKPSVSYYHEWSGTAMAHKHLADAIALQSQLPCLVLKVGELPMLQSVAPVVEVVEA